MGDGADAADAETKAPPLRVAVAGFGAVGGAIVAALTEGVPGLTLGAIGVRDVAAARARLGSAHQATPVVTADALEPLADVVVECVPAAAVRDVIDRQGGRRWRRDSHAMRILVRLGLILRK